MPQAHDGMMHFIKHETTILRGSYMGCYKTPPLKESRPEIPTEERKGRDTSDEDPLRFPTFLLYQNDETTTL